MNFKISFFFIFSIPYPSTGGTFHLIEFKKTETRLTDRYFQVCSVKKFSHLSSIDNQFQKMQILKKGLEVETNIGLIANSYLGDNI